MPLDPSHGYPMPSLRYVETMGSRSDQADSLIEGFDATMRDAYDVHIARVGDNVYPMIYVDFTLYGGRYTLVESPGKIHVRAPDLRGYAQLKSCAHVPLGLFVMIAEYAQYPDNGQWRPAVQAFKEQLEGPQGIGQLEHCALTNREDIEACRAILQATIDHAAKILETGRISLEEFAEYTRPLSAHIVRAATSAATIQVTRMTEIVNELRQILGSRWDEVFVVVSALWTLSQENVHALIIGHQMTPERRETNLIVSEGVETIEDAKLLLGRIVGDRIAAQYVFSDHSKLDDLEDIYSLSTQRDLLSRPTEQVLGSDELKQLCPHIATKR